MSDPGPQRPGAQGLAGQRATLVRAVRVCGHACLLVRGVRYSRSRKRLIALAGVSIAGDVALARVLSRSDRNLPWTRAALDGIEAHLWARLGAPGDVLYARTIQIVTAVPHALEAGFRFRAGTEARPRVNPPLAYPPASAIEWGARTAAAAVPVTVPSLSAALAYRRRRLPLEVNQTGWGALAAAMGGGLAQRREAFQRSIRLRWEERTVPWLRGEWTAARVRAATVVTPGHDFKKTLAAIGHLGSVDAADAAREQGAHPEEVLETSPGGDTVWDVCQGLRVWPEPPSAWSTWLTDEQIDQLRDVVRAADEELGPGVDEEVTLDIEATSGKEVVVRYRGRVASLQHSRPVPTARLDPVALSLLLAGAWKALTPIMAGTAVTPAALAASLDALGFIRYIATPPSDADETTVLAFALASTALLDLAIAAGASRERGASGELAFAATPATMGLLFVIGRYGRSLEGRRWLLLGAAMALWAIGAGRTAKANPLAALAELCFLVMVPWATAGLDERIEFEADYLENELDAALEHDLEAARIGGIEEELERFNRHLELADAELDRIEQYLDPTHQTLVARLRQDCDQLRSWLNNPESRQWLAS